ncbi:MAG: DUF1028 domain-containing protein [Candidatus Thorarchaeota archaeon]|nr:DUF1028 domain-containing protein [Candidatus Thorarchaeota archaeon]
MTFSIVAVDRERKEVGFAISSCFWNAGQVGFAKMETGAIVSQAQGNMEFIPVFFEKLEDGMSVEEILEIFKNMDDKIENRQVGMIAFRGNALAFTGSKVSSSFQKIGTDYACQGNILVGKEVIDNIAKAFEESEGSLADRLYTALQAGDDAGGDMRGKISARVYVERDRKNPLTHVTTDFNVEEHPEPVREIGRLLALRKSIITAWELTEVVSKTNGKEKDDAMIALAQFLEDKRDRVFLDFFSSLAEAYLEVGDREKAIATFKIVVEISPRMATTLDDYAIKDEVLS